MFETKIIVNRFEGELWYKAEYRKIYFLFRGRWKNIRPAWHRNIEKVETQVRDFYITKL